MPQSPDLVLSVEQLTKTYTTFKKEAGLIGSLKSLIKRDIIQIPAVKALTLSVNRGEFIGLLGPNGAGKTTTLKMLTGLIKPSAGRALAFTSYDTAKRHPAYLRRIGMVMGQRNQLNPDLPAVDSFRLAQAIYNIDEHRYQSRLKLCAGLFEVEALLNTPVRKLSLGERMKMELILAILHEPELLFLDEPTIGLDFNAARQIRGFLAEANKRLGITVVLTSHYTKDIEELCRRVVLINHGSIVYDGPLTGMDNRLAGQKIVTLMLADHATRSKAVAALAELSSHDATVKVAAAEPDAEPLQLSFDVGMRQSAEILHRLLAQIGTAAVTDLKVGERPLDDIFGEIYLQPLHPQQAQQAQQPLAAAETT